MRNYGYDSLCRRTYTYDDLGRVTEIDNLGTPSLPRVILTQAFDAVGNRLSVSANVAGTDDYQNDYQYDGLHRMTQVTQQGQSGGNTVAEKRVDFSYNNLGQFTEITRYSDIAGLNEVATSTYQYDTNARLEDLTHRHDTTTIAQYTWTYDNLNRISNFTSPDADVTYQYDETGQLTGADYDTASGINDESYQYDLAGNRINTGYSTGANNQLLSDGTYNYTYDNEGNRSTRTEIATGELTEYEWDHRNRLTSVITKNSGGTITHQVDYTYDVFNRRIIKSIDSDGAGSSTATEERYIYDGDHIALVYDQTNQLTNRLLHGPAIDQVLADEQFINGLFDEVLWPLTDHLGSVRDLVDNDGNIENHIVYDSFGNILSETDTSVDHLFGYTGRETDEETDLYYYRNRYYDADIGRFISEDPIGFNAGDVNIVRYVGNSPLNYIDPDGLDKIAVVGGIDPEGRAARSVYWDSAGGQRVRIGFTRNGIDVILSESFGRNAVPLDVLERIAGKTDSSQTIQDAEGRRVHLIPQIYRQIQIELAILQGHSFRDTALWRGMQCGSSGGERQGSLNSQARSNRQAINNMLRDDLKMGPKYRKEYNKSFADEVNKAPGGWVAQTLIGPEAGDTTEGLQTGATEVAVSAAGSGLWVGFSRVALRIAKARDAAGAVWRGSLVASSGGDCAAACDRLAQSLGRSKVIQYGFTNHRFLLYGNHVLDPTAVQFVKNSGQETAIVAAKLDTAVRQGVFTADQYKKFIQIVRPDVYDELDGLESVVSKCPKF